MARVVPGFNKSQFGGTIEGQAYLAVITALEQIAEFVGVPDDGLTPVRELPGKVARAFEIDGVLNFDRGVDAGRAASESEIAELKQRLAEKVKTKPTIAD